MWLVSASVVNDAADQWRAQNDCRHEAAIRLRYDIEEWRKTSGRRH